MILDKTGLMKILHTDSKEFEPIKESRKDGILIRTINDGLPFDVSNQVGNDSIDLRISDHGYIMSNHYDEINTLSDSNFDEFYDEVNLPISGFVLKPGELLFVTTHERIALSGNLIGRITGRSVFARMGLSVHCTQDKFSSGINSVAGLQIINNSPVPLRIFPYQKLAQILIEKTAINRHPYNGRYCEEIDYTLPLVQDKDREQYNKIDLERILRQKAKKRPIWKRKTTDLTVSVCRVFFSALVTVAMAVFGCIDFISSLIVAGVAGIIADVCFMVIDFRWRENNDGKKE